MRLGGKYQEDCQEVENETRGRYQEACLEGESPRKDTVETKRSCACTKEGAKGQRGKREGWCRWSRRCWEGVRGRMSADTLTVEEMG